MRFSLEEFKTCLGPLVNASAIRSAGCDLEDIQWIWTGLIYVQLYHEITVADVVDEIGLGAEQARIMADAAKSIGRIDLQLDWLEWAVSHVSHQADWEEIAREELYLAKERSDQVLLSSGGVSYDGSTNSFLVARKHLDGQKKRTREEVERVERLRQIVAQPSLEMPHHNKDMFYDATYMNRLTVLREDLLAELCQGNSSRRPSIMDAPLRCHRQLHESPFLRLAPHMVEEFNLEPYIVLFHR